MKQPNIVLIMADQLAPHFTAPYGHRSAKTPHMSALSARGMRFDAALLQFPALRPQPIFLSCQGNWSAASPPMITGASSPATVPTFAHYLQSLGYRTCLSGKMHFVGPDQKHGFADRITTRYLPVGFRLDSGLGGLG